MQPFIYTKGATEQGVLASLAAASGSVPIAGGTDLLDLMKLGLSTPSQLIDINALPLASIEITPGGATIGALSRLSDVAHHTQLQKRFPVISQALLASASGQIRNMATIGGNLLQRTRCPYFREPEFPCNKHRPGSGCSALTGINRGNAILGGSSSCVAVHPSDLAVALVALGANVLITGSSGGRKVSVEDLYVLPADTPQIETVLQAGELITGVEVSQSPMASQSLYLKVRDRASFEFALVSVAAAVEMKGKTIRAAAIALGGVAPRPWRNAAAERGLQGKPASMKLFSAAADTLLGGAQPLAFNGFKLDMARNVVCRALSELTGVT